MAVDADPPQRARGRHELVDIVPSVVFVPAGDEIGGCRPEDNELAILADCRITAPLRAGALPVSAYTHRDVAIPVAVDDVGHGRRAGIRAKRRVEHEVAAIGAQARVPAVAVQRMAVGREAFERDPSAQPIEDVDVRAVVGIGRNQPRVPASPRRIGRQH